MIKKQWKKWLKTTIKNDKKYDEKKIMNSNEK